MTSNGGPALPGYHEMWNFIQDTEYNFASTNDFNCNYLRGNTNADLFLLNHFLTVATPQPLSATATNAWGLVLDRARQCSTSRGLHPNLLYIDFFNSGDVFRAADTLNRIGEDFPSVHGSAALHYSALQYGLLSELYTMPNQGYAPFSSNWGDSATAFVADFMIRHFPCEMSCATPIDQIIGQDSIWKDSVYTYTINNNQGASYLWFTNDSIYTNSNVIHLSSHDSTGLLALNLIETSQYGCVYDTISTQITIFTNTAIHFIENSKNIRIYPNPTQDIIWIEIDSQEPYTCQIYDHHGRLVLQKNQLLEKTALNLDALSAGIYILKIIGKEQFIGKITKMN